MITHTEAITVQLMALFSSDNAPAISLKIKEIAILDAIQNVGKGGICAADVHSALAEVTGKTPRVATVYNTILELQRKKLLEVVASSSQDSGGRPRRLFELTDRGRLALQLGRAMASDAQPFVPA